MSYELITDTQRFQGTGTKPTVGVQRGSRLFDEDTGKEFRFTGSEWIPSATEILGDSGYAIDDNHPLPIGGDSLYAKNIDVSGSTIGTFTGSVTDLVDDLDTTIYDNSATSPKYFEVKLKRPINNSGIKFCSPVGEDFSNVKITLKDRSGATLKIFDDSANNTKYSSWEYEWPLVAFCTIRVEFYTTDPVHINWMLLERSEAVHKITKLIDPQNSTTTTLGIDGVWVGSWVNTRNFVQAIIDITVDKPSAANGLAIELSNDGVTVVHSHTFNILANTPNGHHYPSELELNFYRLKYTNGAQAQTSFKLFSTLFDAMIEEGHSHNLDYPLQDDHPAPIVRAVQTGKKPNGDYVNAEFTAGGNPKASIEEYDPAVSPFRADIEGKGIQTVGTTAVELVFTGTPTRSISVSAMEGNDGYIFVGKSNVNSAGANAFDYIPAGQNFTIDYDDATNPLYIVGSAAGQEYIAGAVL